MAPAIRIEGLTKDYAVGFWRPRPYRALDRLTLDIEPGEVFGFLGPNGAGKTTTLKLLMQLIFPTSGRAEILGRPVGDVGRAAAASATCRKTPTSTITSPPRSCSTYFARLFGYRGADRTRRVSALLDRVGHRRERRLQLRKFSKGMIQRVGIAQALLNDPEVMFLDEPMSGLDPLGRRDVRSLILELRDQGADGLLQLAHPVGRRSALQPGRGASPAAGSPRPAGSPRFSPSRSAAGNSSSPALQPDVARAARARRRRARRRSLAAATRSS